MERQKFTEQRISPHIVGHNSQHSFIYVSCASISYSFDPYIVFPSKVYCPSNVKGKD
uniref:Uncharacterized protein n=1 Tax=Arundo donax TaxID=35708 RepID=A0A0A9CAJ6_ARUDO